MGAVMTFSSKTLLIISLLAANTVMAGPSRLFTVETADVAGKNEINLDLVNSYEGNNQIRAGVFSGELIINPQGGTLAMSKQNMGFKRPITDNLSLLAFAGLDTRKNENNDFQIGVVYTLNEQDIIVSGNIGAGSDNDLQVITAAAGAFYKLKQDKLHLGAEVSWHDRKGSATGFDLGIRWFVKQNLAMDLVFFAQPPYDALKNYVATPVGAKLNYTF